jgi:hypothetical protein
MTLVNQCDDDADEWMGGYNYLSLCWMVRADDYGDKAKFLEEATTQIQRAVATTARPVHVVMATALAPRCKSA